MQLELPNEIIDHFKLQLAAANNNVAANYRIIRIHLKKHEYRLAWPLIKELVKSNKFYEISGPIGLSKIIWVGDGDI